MKPTWYVRENPAGAGHGADRNNAFSVSNINWSSIKEGDTIIVEYTHRTDRVPHPLFIRHPAHKLSPA